MPKVNLKMLASFRELAGQECLEADATTPREAIESLSCGADILDQTPLVAVNHTIVELDHALAEGDEVAVMPPMTGG